MSSLSRPCTHPTNPMDDFRNFLLNFGLRPDEIVSDGKLHRCPVDGKPNAKDGWYVFHADAPASGACGNWRTGESTKWTSKEEHAMSSTERRMLKTRVVADKLAREAETDQRHAEAAAKAQRILADATDCGEHPYLERKGVKPCPDLKVGYDDRLLVPVLAPEDGKPMSVQTIAADGGKLFLAGGRTKGGCFPIEGTAGRVFICEGLATGLSIHVATGQTVLCAFNAGNLEAVAAQARQKYPDRELVLCADDDHGTDGNPGVSKATAAARAVGAFLAVPSFKEPAGQTDFNDLHQAEGIEAVRAQVAITFTPSPSGVQAPVASATNHQEDMCDEADEDKPTLIVQSGELVALADAAENILLKAETPLFQRGGLLVHPAQLPEPTHEHGVERAAGTTIIKTVSAHRLLDCLGRQARFAKLKRQDKPLYVDPPMALAQAMLSRVGSWRFKPLRGVLPGPSMREDGSILNTVGYDEASCYYLAEPLALLLPASPTKDDAARALALLTDLLREFPFESATDMAVALAMILTPLARPAVGKIPLFCVNSPTRGSGKSTLVRLAATLSTGRPAPVIAATGSGDELEKRLTASLLAGDGLILLDNINGELRSDLLSQAVTEGTLAIRPLGVSDQVQIVSDAIWIANGNGLTIGGDLSRRALKCTLDPKLERPERRNFEGDPVREAQLRRPELVAAGLTVLRAYHLHGRPGVNVLRPWAGFGHWSSLVRGALVWLGMPDPLDSADQLQADDPERELLGALLKEWHNQYGNREMTVREVISETGRSDMDREELSDLLKEIAGAGMTLGINARSLGRWLTSKNGKIVDGRYLKKAGSTGGSVRWQVLTR